MGAGKGIGHQLKRFLNEIYRVIEITEGVSTSERVTDATCYRALQNVTPRPGCGETVPDILASYVYVVK